MTWVYLAGGPINCYDYDDEDGRNAGVSNRVGRERSKIAAQEGLDLVVRVTCRCLRIALGGAYARDCRHGNAGRRDRPRYVNAD